MKDSNGLDDSLSAKMKDLERRMNRPSPRKSPSKIPTLSSSSSSSPRAASTGSARARQSRRTLEDNTWNLLETDLSMPKQGAGVVAIPDDEDGTASVYILGGWDKRKVHDTVDIWRQANEGTTDGTITQSPSKLPTARYGFGSVAAGTQKSIWVCGGIDSRKTVLSSVDRFIVDTGEWIAMPPLRHARHGCVALLYHDQIHVLGGLGPDNQCVKEVEVWNERQSSWQTATHIDPMSIPCAHMSGIVMHNQTYLVGGQNTRGDDLDVIQIWNGSYWKTCAMPCPRSQCGAAVYQDNDTNYLVVVGGSTSLSSSRRRYLKSLDILNLQTLQWVTSSKPTMDMWYKREGCSVMTVNDAVWVAGGASGGFNCLDCIEMCPWKDLLHPPQVAEVKASPTAVTAAAPKAADEGKFFEAAEQHSSATNGSQPTKGANAGSIETTNTTDDDEFFEVADQEAENDAFLDAAGE